MLALRMTPTPDPDARPFRALQHRLLGRRFASLEGILRVELGLLALLLGGYLFFQVRPLLEDLSFQRGPRAVGAGVLAAGLALAALGAGLTAARHRRRLVAPEGPAWLALPVDARAIGRHLAWESRFQIGWVVVPALGVLAAAVGLVPLAALPVLAGALAALLALAGRVGTALGTRAAVRAAEVRPGLPALHRVLAGVPRPGARLRLPAARWRWGPPWQALVEKDGRLAGRSASLRQGAQAVAALALVSLLGWLLPGDPGAAGRGAAAALDFRNLATFFITLLCAAAFAEWLVVLTGSDPFAVLRALPLGVGDVWRARFAWALAFTVLLAGGHALLAHGLAWSPRLLFLSWVAGATLGLAVLGTNLGLTLYPHGDAARRLLGLTLVLMAIVSTVIYLMGWLVLAAAIAWTARRLPRWERAVDAAAGAD
jgi:hypothetical protein